MSNYLDQEIAAITGAGGADQAALQAALVPYSDQWVEDRRLPRCPIAVGILGQSNERGQVDPNEAISGVLSRIAHPQAYASLRNPALRFPIAPALTKMGGLWFKLYDDLYDHGYDTHFFNSGIGSASMIRDICGQIQTRANSTGFRQRRAPVGFGDNGYTGDLMVIQGRLFVCTRGLLAFASNSNSFDTASAAPDLDYINLIGTNATAASEPAGLATAAVGDVVVDGTVEWTCLATGGSGTTSGAYQGYTYVAGNMISEVRKGFDPFSLCRRLLDGVMSVKDARARIVMLANAQSDTGNANLSYQSALENVGSFFLQRGVKVALGLSFYQPSVGTTPYNNLTTRVNNALASLRASGSIPALYALADVITGANLYTLLGSTGSMASGGAYFIKDSGQDNIHVNALGAIAGGAAWSDVFKAILPQLSAP